MFTLYINVHPVYECSSCKLINLKKGDSKLNLINLFLIKNKFFVEKYRKTDENVENFFFL